jgi:hypothetical protein
LPAARRISYHAALPQKQQNFIFYNNIPTYKGEFRRNMGSLIMQNRKHTSLACNPRGWLNLFASAIALALASGAQAQTCFDYTGAIENWTVPDGVTEITAEAWGAAGGDSTWLAPRSGGLGAYMSGEFNVTAGDNLKILVGGQGETNAVGGGGGGSFLTTSGDVPLLVAGGGGGASSDQDGVGAVTGQDGTADSLGIIAGGTGGNGGGACAGDNSGGGGGGLNTDGVSVTDGVSTVGGFGGIAFVNGGTIVPGGRLDNACDNDPAGGFGGGGSATCNTVGGGGGGGYSGGAGGPHIGMCAAPQRAGGGGGGSFNSGVNQTNTPATRSGNGQICITILASAPVQPADARPVPVASPWLLALTAAALALLALAWLRKRA